MSSTLCCFCHTGTSVHLVRPPPPFSWQVQVTYTKSQFQRFLQLHWAVQIRFQLYSSSQSPAHLSSVFFFLPIPPCFLALRSLSLLSIISSASALYLPNFPADISASWFRPISFHTFSTTLSHRKNRAIDRATDHFGRPIDQPTHSLIDRYFGRPIDQPTDSLIDRPSG